jgi:hypothetical protein
MDPIRKIVELFATLFSDTLTAVLIGVLGAIVLLTIVYMALTYRGIKRGLSFNLDEGHDDASRRPTSLAAALLKERVETVGDGQSSFWVLRREPRAIASDHVAAELGRSESFKMGHRFTGFALIITFFLIAVVLVTYVSQAIGPKADPEKLPEAVKLLGAKFTVSAFGVVLSLVHAWVSTRLHVSLDATASRVIDRWEKRLIPLEAYRLRLSQAAERRTEERAEVLDGRLAEVLVAVTQTRAASDTQREVLDDHVARAGQALQVTVGNLETRLQKLGSIEVSIKDMGAQVEANLGNIMRDSVGQQMCAKIEEVTAQVDKIAMRVEESLRDAVGAILTQEIQRVRDALDAIRTAVEQQGGSQVEKILEQLRDTVSGGFQSESRAMAASLQQFASVVPDLERGMRALVASMSTDMSDRTAKGAQLAEQMIGHVAELIPRLDSRLQALTTGVTEQLDAQARSNAATTSELLGQVSSLVRLLEQQQAGMGDALARLATASTEGAQRMVAAIATEADTRVSRVAEAATQEFQTTLVSLREAATLATAAHAGVQRAGVEAQRTMSEVLVETQRAVKELAAAGRASAEHGDRALALAREVQTVTENLRQIADVLGRHTAGIRETVVQQNEVQKRQQANLERIEQVMPRMFETYGKSFEKNAEALALSWQGHADDVGKLVKTVSNEFVEGVEGLSESVEKLERALGLPGAR